MEEYSRALTPLKKALEIRETSLPANHSDLAVSHNNIGNACLKMRNYSHALISHRKALEIPKQGRSVNHPDLGRTYAGMRLAEIGLGNTREGIQLSNVALRIYESHGNKFESIVTRLTNLISIC